MRDLQKYWREVRELERGLPAFVWLVSLEDRRRGQTGGVISEVPAEQAAKLLHAKSHRAASEEEIAGHVALRSATLRREFQESLRRQGIRVVAIEGVAIEETVESKKPVKNVR